MEYKVGDEVLAPWMNDGYFYPAVIVEFNGNTAHVAYYDGDESDVNVSELRQGVLGPGLRVSVNYKGHGEYLDGTIQRRVGIALYLNYDNGDQGWATVNQCRVENGILSTIDPGLTACQYCGAAIEAQSPSCQYCGMSRTWRS